VLLRKGDTIALPPDTPHAFRVVGNEVLRLLGTHASPHRIVIRRDRSAPGPRPEAEQDAETA
jgi:mannose-6-phosphate isomerase-like protein (cupin superfamily)